jgi:hypothetical protein
MYFPSGPSPNRYVRLSSPRHRESGPVYAVGHRVLIEAPAGRVRTVTLMDALDGVACGTVANGAPVEILAWQPAGTNGTRYRVRSASDGIEGWLNGRELRALERPVPARPIAVAAKPASVPRRGKAAKPRAAASRA